MLIFKEVDMQIEADPYSAATKIALNALSRRAKSRGELYAVLLKKNTEPDLIDRVLDRLTEHKLIDDQAFANDWSRSRHIYKGLSRNVLARELRQKGVGDSEISIALEQIASESEMAVATALIAKKLRSLQRENSEVKYRRISGFLARKGYSYQLISQLLRESDL